MLKEKYIVGQKILYIYCEIQEYCETIRNWLVMFECAKNIGNHASIEVFGDKTVYCILGKKHTIFGRILHTDLYPLIFNTIANIYNDENNTLLHSAILCYNNSGILLLGDFGSGKTELCKKSLKYGFKILSADQSCLNITDGDLRLRYGSIFMKTRNNEVFFLTKSEEQTNIVMILNLIGVNTNGNLEFYLINEANHKLKQLFKYCTWHADIPLFTNNEMLILDRIKIKKFLSKIKIPIYNVYGDANNILKKIKEILND